MIVSPNGVSAKRGASSEAPMRQPAPLRRRLPGPCHQGREHQMALRGPRPGPALRLLQGKSHHRIRGPAQRGPPRLRGVREGVSLGAIKINAYSQIEHCMNLILSRGYHIVRN